MRSAAVTPVLLVVSAAVFVTIAACGGNGPRTPDEVAQSSRQEVLVSLTRQVIVPRYREAAESVRSLADSAPALCASPAAGALETARADWRAARDAWTATEAFRFGPAMERRSLSLVDWWPVSVEAIEETISEGQPVTPETVRQFLPSTHRGMSAMEHLLFGEGSETLARPGAEVRCSYLAALASVTHEEIAGIYGDWGRDWGRDGGRDGEGEEQSTGYAGDFDGTAKLSLDPRDGEAEVVRSLVFLVRTIANMRLGAALGVDTEADPEAIPSGPAGNSTRDLRRQLSGISEMYQGAEGHPQALGIGHVVRQLSPEVDDRMVAAIENTARAIEGVEGSLELAVANNPEVVRNIYDNFKELQRVLNTEVVSLLGVSVGFSDTDGDS